MGFLEKKETPGAAVAPKYRGFNCFWQVDNDWDGSQQNLEINRGLEQCGQCGCHKLRHTNHKSKKES